jgi:hypothetical protein
MTQKLMPKSKQPYFEYKEFKKVENINTNIDFLPSFDFVFNIEYNRTQKTFDNIDNLENTIKLSNHLSCQHFDMTLIDEQGVGQSVFEEVLKLHWDQMIKTGVMVFIDNEIEQGYCLLPTIDFEEMKNSDKIVTDCFLLGFISSLCILRGLYLPYGLVQSLWEYLELGQCDLVSTFKNFHIQSSLVADVSNESLPNVLGIYEEKNTILSKEDRFNFECKVFLPDNQLLKAFKDGWMKFDKTLDLLPLIEHKENINHIFVSDENSNICNYKNFKEIFIDRDIKKDEMFLKYVETLSQDKLLRLVEFITGKKRLPLLNIGEQKIVVVWCEDNGKTKLPISQNCHNSILLSNHLIFSQLENCLHYIYDYESDFGKM